MLERPLEALSVLVRYGTNARAPPLVIRGAVVVRVVVVRRMIIGVVGSGPLCFPVQNTTLHVRSQPAQVEPGHTSPHQALTP